MRKTKLPGIQRKNVPNAAETGPSGAKNMSGSAKRPTDSAKRTTPVRPLAPDKQEERRPTSQQQKGKQKMTNPTKLKPISTSKQSKENSGNNLRVKDKVLLPGIRSMMQKFSAMLEGCLEGLPPKSSSEVRIFLSSTFSDMRAERNWLVRVALPELKEFCADLELDFRFLDMRWGVTDDALNEHVTERLCLQEVTNCQRLSLGPNFITLLGDRYGYRPIPAEVETQEFEVLLDEARKIQHPKQDELLMWYMKDDNAIPPVYVLQAIKTRIPHFGDYSPGSEEKRQAANATWWRTLAGLQEVMREAAMAAEQSGKMTAQRRHTYFRSVTECEVDQGILSANNPGSHSLCYTRNMKGLDTEVLSQKNANRYIDTLTMDEKTILDESAGRLREDLKNKKVISALGSSNRRSYEVLWQEGGINETDTEGEHCNYLKMFSTHFVQDTKRLIQDAVKAKQNIVPASEYYTDFEECLHHLHFCNLKCATFRGQEEILEKIRERLSGNSRKPLIIHAESGVGKTSIMAMVMKLIPQWFGPESIRIIRFLGTSPYSQDIYSVVRGFAGQIADNIDALMEPVGYANMAKLNKYLPRFLRNASRSLKHPAFILLDSVDQLSATDKAYSMDWLPVELPANIHIVISTLPEEHGCLANMKQRLPDESCYIEVKPIPETTGKEIIESYLSSKHRNITSNQRSMILEKLQYSPSPLFLKLCLDQAVMWRSLTPVDTIHLGSSVRDAIDMLFERLEGKFGHVLMSHALGYMTIGYNGLSEVELEDALSCDDEVLNEVYQYHDPPVEGVVRIPPLLWSRAKQDFSEYVTDRRSYGKNTIFWYHRQFIEAANHRYTQGEAGEVLHHNLASLYMSQEPIQRGITLQKRKLTLDVADRQVALQPMIKKNRRMLVCLIYHLTRCGDIDLLKKSALYNLKYIMTYIDGFSLPNLVTEYQKTLEHLKELCLEDYELNDVKNIFNSMQTSLKSVNLVPVEILARLNADTNSSSHLVSLLQQARDWIERQRSPTLLPVYACLTDSDLLKWHLMNSTFDASHVSSDSTLAVLQEQASDKLKYSLVSLSSQNILVDDLNKSGSSSEIFISLDRFDNSLYILRLPDTKSPKGATNSDFQIDVRKDTTTSKIVLALAKGQKVMGPILFSVQGKTAVISYSSMLLNIWSIPDGKLLRNAVQFVGWGHIYHVLVLASDFILALATESNSPDAKSAVLIVRREAAKKGKGQKPPTQEENQTEQNKDGIMQLPGKLDETSLMVFSDNETIVGFCPGLKQVIVVDVYRKSIVQTISVDHTDRPAFCVHPFESILICAAGMYSVSTITLPDGENTRRLEVKTEVVSIDVDEAAEYLIIGGKDGLVYIHNYDTLELLGYYQGHNEAVYKVLITHNQEHLITVGPDKQIKVWNFNLFLRACQKVPNASTNQTGQQNDDLAKCENAQDIFFTDDGLNLVASTSDNKICIWNLEDGAQNKVVPVPGSITKLLLACDSSHVIVQYNEKDMGLWNIETSENVPLENIQGETKVFTLNEKKTKAYILIKEDSKFAINVIDLPSGKCAKSVRIKDKINTQGIEMRISDSEKYVIFSAVCTDKELEIIRKSDKALGSNGLVNRGHLKFMSLNLSKSSACLQIHCRILTKIPSLGNCWEVLQDNTVLIGKDRVTVLWDLDSGKSDQRISKGTKMPMFYRPWIEGALGEQEPMCFGQTLCMTKSKQGGIMAIGSEDGWLMTYDTLSGLSIQNSKTTNPKKPNHGSPVTQVAVSDDDMWVASVSQDMTLKVWSVSEKGLEVFSLKLTSGAKTLKFSPSGKYLGVLTMKANNTTRIHLFRIVPGSQ